MCVWLEIFEGVLFFLYMFGFCDIIFYFVSIIVIFDGDFCDLVCVVCVVCNFVIDVK